MNFAHVDHIKSLFSALSSGGFDYLLMRNTGDELPNELRLGKDIDILVRSSDRDRLLQNFKRCGFDHLKHPMDANLKNSKAIRFDWFASQFHIFIDVNYMLTHLSADQSQIELFNPKVQSIAWEGRRQLDLHYFVAPFIGMEAELITLITRCLRDKRFISEWNFKHILHLYENTSKKDLVHGELEAIFPEQMAFIYNILKCAQWNKYLLEDFIFD